VAKRFEFRLQTLLRVRELREREAKRKVGAKQAEIARIDQLNQQTADEIARCQDDLRARQRAAVLAPDQLTRERAWIAYLRRTVVERQALRARRRAELDMLRDELRQARMQRRIIEKLRERRWAEYAKDRQRREQAEADELAQQLHTFKGARVVGDLSRS
jgi:flagellar FliJ protein